MDEATQRRCAQELGFQTPLRFLYKFEYHARFQSLGSEHELCSVYAGAYNGEPRINTNEIEAWQWVAPPELDQRLDEHPQSFTPWFKLEWQQIRSDHAAAIAGLNTRTEGF